jgi:nucleoside-diphosphate-sugar epimerase
VAPVLVTGASGFIGSALVATLRAAGRDVVAGNVHEVDTERRGLAS